MDFITKLHIIDIIFLILCLRIVYSSLKWGLISEFLRLGGIVAVVLIVLQPKSFSAFSDTLNIGFLAGKVPFAAGLVFLVFIFIASVLFGLLAKCAKLFISEKEVSSFERIFSFFLGLVRFGFISSAVFFGLFLMLGKAGLSERSYINKLTWKIMLGVYLKIAGYFDNGAKGMINEEVKRYYEVRNVL